MQSAENSDEVSRFWSHILMYLHAYTGFYFSIRSGNWNLRNACLPKLTELFFAYFRNKYEELACQNINDITQWSNEFLWHFQQGEWTVSITGNKFHNVAIDEGHEQVINKRLKELTARPSEYQTVTLANFMAFLDKIMSGMEQIVFKFSKRKSYHYYTVSKYVNLMHDKLRSKGIFSLSQTRKLKNILNEKSHELTNEQCFDLLNVAQIGKERMCTYIKQYIFNPPLEVPKKRRRRKLKTFTRQKATKQSQTSKVSRLTKLLKGLNTQIQKVGHFMDRILEFPLAISDELGEMRARQKSIIKDTLLEHESLAPIFQITNPIRLTESPTEIIIDFLKFIHSPPSPIVQTYKQLAEEMWNQVVIKLGFGRGGKIVTLVIDKPTFLPKIRDMLHTERHRKLKGGVKIPKIISDTEKILHGDMYVGALADGAYTSHLISYLCHYFLEKGKTVLKPGQSLIIDSDAMGNSPKCSQLGSVLPMTSRTNDKGEADCGVWFHAKASHCESILVLAGDTDIYICMV